MRASSSDRSVACPASLVLPTVHRERPEKTRRAAEWGTLCHHWVETNQTDPDWANPSDVATLEKKLLLSGIKREEWWSGGTHEATFALQLFTLELLEFGDGGHLSRDEWKAQWDGVAGWLTGTADYVYPDGSIRDLKSGRWPVDAATSRQLLSYALFPWVRAGCPLVGWNVFVGIDWWRKYPLVGLPTRSEHPITGFDLFEHLEDLRWSVRHPGEINPSEESCRFCESRPLCPAWVDANQGSECHQEFTDTAVTAQVAVANPLRPITPGKG